MHIRGEKEKFRRGVRYTFSFIALIWLVKLIEFSFSLDFGSLGILPRTLHGSIGIFTSPLIHGGALHLLSNTFPLLFLGLGLFYFYDRIAIAVVILIYLMTGFWVWLAARDAYHIGASGIVYGLLTFLLFSGFFRKDTKTLAISFSILILYGGSFFAGIIPNRPGISWESHLMGAVAGIFCAVYFKKSDVVKEVEEIIDQPNTKYNYTYLTKPSRLSKTGISYHYIIKKGEKEDDVSNTC